MTKKNPYKFTIGFKKNNVSHQKVADILNTTEDKADLIANAVLSYFGGNESSEPVDSASLHLMIETIVKREIEKVQKINPIQEEKREEAVIDISDSGEEGMNLDEQVMEHITDALDLFRSR